TAIAEVPGIGRNGIARRLGITGAAVTWHIRRLEHDGIVCQVSTEKTVRYVIPGEILACLSRGTLPAAGQVQEEPAAQAPAS
ncbi:MAG: winged helix-turn-helix domain-containing protein, partial [Methanoregula sp.]